MSFGAIVVLALGLAMDATAVAAARGTSVPAIRLRHIVLAGGLFGGFQAAMPVVGWIVGARVGRFIESWDHWVAFGLLAAIGGKMIWESRAIKTVDTERDPFGLGVMTVLAIATSIDALAVGITLPVLGAPLVESIVTIGVVTAALSIAGLYAGRRFGALLGKRLDVVGGLVLIGLGIKILVDGLT